jgi:flotillin
MLGSLSSLGVFAVLGVLVLVLFVSVLTRYRRCPSDRILVIFGKVGGNRAAKTIHGGAALVWPVIQSYKYLSLTPMTIDIALKSALSKQNIRVDVPSRFTIGISTKEEILPNAVERLLSMQPSEIEEAANEIIFGHGGGGDQRRPREVRAGGDDKCGDRAYENRSRTHQC